jgi:propanol-preferring alcohol dehydrogenase
MVLRSSAAIEGSPLQCDEVTMPLPRPGEVRVQVRCCGVCHTDLHICEGELELPKLPLVPGHQIVGIVDALGSGVRSLKAGDRVGVPWLYSTDGTCDYCRRGLENLCSNARFTGYHVDGGYAEYVTVPEGSAYALPAAFSDDNAAPLLCGGVIGYRSYRLSGVGKGERLGLFGFGASAHLVLQLARYEGCEVYVFTRAQPHRDLARQMGAAWAGRAEDTPPGELDAGIIFAPAGSLVPLALSRLRRAGTLVLAGITMSAIPKFDYSLLYYERHLRSVANSTHQDVREFLDLAAQARLQTEIEIFPLEKANLALQKLKRSEVNGACVLRVEN